jgi:AraC family transcriptional regulator of adaptative response/methylated-DNA-[protein]-cysteine methyltransferase
MIVRYAIAACALGRVLAARTERGVCAVSLGATDADLVRDLGAGFPEVRIDEDRRALEGTIATLVTHLAGRQPRLDLPIDVHATAFQSQVWSALATIPYGETRSYSEIAASIGRPRACRAVARACAANPVAVIIPCHRAVPAAGGVGGYRWGRARKTALLARERAAARRSRS